MKEVVPALIEPQAVQKVAPCSRANTILNMAVVPPVLQKSLKWIIFTSQIRDRSYLWTTTSPRKLSLRFRCLFKRKTWLNDNTILWWRKFPLNKAVYRSIIWQSGQSFQANCGCSQSISFMNPVGYTTTLRKMYENEIFCILKQGFNELPYAPFVSRESTYGTAESLLIKNVNISKNLNIWSYFDTSVL